ncbi:hypothetical protein F4820DRAFT_465268 [Hypoxylon rubiginosum]|uniref:Uncharacterized protein n=1 Tax=Hypoxylon rubiginosum TaxID=110542 RepID=A0ACB9ZAQ4_9PEZI|nr:hypothetical protein F4820DRAFT_465268 [Hypoxylon rubiginosum]
MTIIINHNYGYGGSAAKPKVEVPKRPDKKTNAESSSALSKSQILAKRTKKLEKLHRQVERLEVALAVVSLAIVQVKNRTRMPMLKLEKPEYGHVLDKTNPCLRFQHDKIDPNPSVKTSDRIPIRMPYAKNFAKVWSSTVDDDVAIKDRCDKLQRDMNRNTKILVVVGRENKESYLDLIAPAANQAWSPAGMKMPKGLRIYDESPSIRTLEDKDTGMV